MKLWSVSGSSTENLKVLPILAGWAGLQGIEGAEKGSLEPEHGVSAGRDEKSERPLEDREWRPKTGKARWCQIPQDSNETRDSQCFHQWHRITWGGGAWLKFISLNLSHCYLDYIILVGWEWEIETWSIMRHQEKDGCVESSMSTVRAQSPHAVFNHPWKRHCPYCLSFHSDTRHKH